MDDLLYVHEQGVADFMYRICCPLCIFTQKKCCGPFTNFVTDLHFSAQGYAYSGHDRIQQQQAEVNEVVGIMKDNVARVLERDQRLSDLDHRAGENRNVYHAL